MVSLIGIERVNYSTLKASDPRFARPPGQRAAGQAELPEAVREQAPQLPAQRVPYLREVLRLAWDATGAAD